VYDHETVTGYELMRKLKKLAAARNVKVVYDSGHGKGSHGRVFFGAAFTALKDPKQDIGVGLLHKMCRDLEIKPADL
jgi:mRNA interferase HicA